MFLNIIIPCYNAEKWIGILIKSIMSQTFQDFHITIVDDISTDNSVREIQRVADEICGGKLTLIQNTEKCFQGKSRNIGFKNRVVDSEYTWFMDADDYLPRKTVFEELYNIVQKKNHPDVIAFQYINDKNGTLYPSKCYMQKYSYDQNFLMLNCTVSPWSKLVKTTQVIDFIESTNWGEDAMWTLQLYDNTDNVVDLTDVFYAYRCIDNGVTAAAKKSIEREHSFTVELEKLLPKVNKITTKLNIIRKLAYQYIQFGK